MKNYKLTAIKRIIGVYVLLGVLIPACGTSERDEKIDSHIKALKKEAAIYSIVAVPNALTGIGEPAVDPLMDAYRLSLRIKIEKNDLGYGDIESTFRRAILNTLAAIPSKKSVKALIRVMENEDEYVQLRSHAAAVLGNPRSDYAIDALRRALKDGESDIRTGALTGLEKIESENAVDALGDVLDGGFDIPAGRIRYTVAALGKIAAKKPGLSKQIVKILDKASGDPRFNSISDLYLVLGEIGGEESVDALVRVQSHNNPEVWREAIAALGKIGEKGVVKAIDALIKNLGHKHPDIRRHTSAALGKIDSPKAVEALSRVLDDVDGGVRTAAFRAMGKIGKTGNVGNVDNTFIDVLETSKDRDTREDAVKALSRSGTVNSLDALIRALKNDTDSSVRQEVLEALKENGSPKAVDGMISALKEDREPYIRGEAARLLGETGSDKALDAIIGALTDTDPGVRRNVVDALIRNRSDKALAAIINLVDDKSKAADTRAKAVRVLGEMYSIKYVDILIRALQDRDNEIRINAAKGLSWIASDKLEKALVRKLEKALVRALKNDSTGSARYSACSGLANLGTTNAVTAIIGALKDKDHSVQTTAIRALESIVKKGGDNSGRSLDALINLLKYGNPIIRQKVFNILKDIDNPKALRAVKQYSLKKK